MSNSVEGNRVFCYQCENEWNRSQGGLQCPRCSSEFVEILSDNQRPDIEDPPEVIPRQLPGAYNNPSNPIDDLAHHRPWPVPDPDEDDIGLFSFNNRQGQGGLGNMAFQAQGSQTSSSTRTFTWRNGRMTVTSSTTARNPQEAAMQDTMNHFATMMGGILGHGPQQQRGMMIGGPVPFYAGNPSQPGAGNLPGEYEQSDLGDDPNTDIDSIFSMIFGGFDGRSGMFAHLLDPARARSGDAVYSQEALDQVISQLMAQNANPGAPPAPEDVIKNLPRKRIDESMLGEEHRAECSICMDEAPIGKEVAVLPCSHWFDFECIESWLKEHGTCPQCRSPITGQPSDQAETPSRRRRASRRSSSIASPLPQSTTDSPSGVREARNNYYSRNQGDDSRPSSSRRASRRSDDGTTNRQPEGEGGGVSGWIRSHLPSLG